MDHAQSDRTASTNLGETSAWQHRSDHPGPNRARASRFRRGHSRDPEDRGSGPDILVPVHRRQRTQAGRDSRLVHDQSSCHRQRKVGAVNGFAVARSEEEASGDLAPRLREMPNEPSLSQTAFNGQTQPHSPNEPNPPALARMRSEADCVDNQIAKEPERAESSSRAELHFPRTSPCQRTCHVREPSEGKPDARRIVAVEALPPPTRLSANGLDTSERSVWVVGDTRRVSRFRRRRFLPDRLSLPTDSTRPREASGGVCRS